MAIRMWSCEDRCAPFVDVFSRTAVAHGYDLQLIVPGATPPSGFTRLLTHYRHLSPNPRNFELASFRRWFEIAARVNPADRFVLADSDLFIGQSFRALPKDIRDFEGLVGSIGASKEMLEDGVNGGFSVWTGILLKEFCDYIVASYESGTEQLAALYATKVAAGNPRASISDMTLLFAWVQHARVPFFNTNQILRDQLGRAIYIDHNFFMPEALGARFAMTLGRKSVHWRQGDLRLQLRDGAPVIAASLHLGGRYKIMAADLEQRSQMGLTAKSAYILGGRTGRKLLAKIGIHR